MGSMSAQDEVMMRIRPAHLPCKIVPGANAIKEIAYDGDMMVEINCDIPLKNGVDVLRCNVYRPKATNYGSTCPAIMTCGPYGKDIPYSVFHKGSYAELPKEQKSRWSAWEVPEPTYWTKQGYAVVRVDEQGSGQSPGFMDTMSDQTCCNFAQAIEWVAQQPWCTGKVGLLGISYYAGTQWRVAALRPRGLACIIPWEGMHDYYRDRVRHGGILSNGFIAFWQNRQINTNQFGVPERKQGGDANLPGLSPRPANVEGTLTPEQLAENRTDQTSDTAANRYLDDAYFASRSYKLEDINVPMLSVANWGGINLHLRGNILGYMGAGSSLKWLYCITGRHDLPFYLPEYVQLQRSFLDAFLRDVDDRNWKLGPNAPTGVPAVTYALRQGNPGFNKTEAERTFSFKEAEKWPLPQTDYVKYNLTSQKTLSSRGEEGGQATTFSYAALHGEGVRFTSAPFTDEATEITGHPLLYLTVSGQFSDSNKTQKDIDVFVTLRHFDPAGQEVFYTGTAGDPVPLTKGWLRASLRKTNEKKSMPFLPWRDYRSAEVQEVENEVQYTLAIELWPTNVVVSKGGRLELEVGPQDQQGCGIFTHVHPKDRSDETFAGENRIHVGPHVESYLVLPFVK